MLKVFAKHQDFAAACAYSVRSKQVQVFTVTLQKPLKNNDLKAN